MEKEGKFTKSFQDLKEYAKMYSDVFRLTLVEKSSKLLSLIIIIFVVLLLTVITLFFCSLALMYKLADIWHSQALGALGMAGIYLILIGVIYIFREKIFINPLIRQFSQILFDVDEPEEEEIKEDLTNPCEYDS
ncbi:MAG: hypothetical protein LUG18_14680 [Candidatus Azobacteroides sp.]|nr:hypothetical protein [Candidatus Azobacteroides sp.]